ncbi:hypothetical protein B0187_00845 [Haemophilus paracuniculus]|uniref:Integrative conjugative element protein, RAQPRD family n=1 Tax=Haemophilus paracuniculus TaxID=734 RepID=A0A1T0AVH3_9PAST|nr:RAQPRD family integrative conjugative element protein [Haemophilus paracuniculus]OOS00872.1 hypothetical protein B0187_00845 [Haemophilus paracuniculus]
MRHLFTLLLIASSAFYSPLSSASEQSELDQAKRQLEAARQALFRAKAEAERNRSRVYFDYASANQDITLIQQGIDRYINSNRAQPRDPRQIRTLSGDYDKVRNIVVGKQ